MKRIDLAGKRFERLTVVRRAPLYIDNQGHPRIRYICRCDCGNEVIVFGRNLRKGNTKSCGCLHKDGLRKRATTHGHARPGQRTRTYTTWQGILQRCTNPNYHKYPTYGGRGIRVCDQWQGEHGYENFLRDMGEAPEGMSIERENNNGNYEPGNCRWATRAEQARNQRSNIRIEFRGRSMILVDWANEIGITYGALKYRLKNWPIEKALTHPAREARP